MRGVEQIPWLYEIICSLYEWSGLAEWRRWLVAGARGRVLDLGSGTGRNRIALSVLLASALVAVHVSVALAGDPFADLDLIRPRQATPAPDFTVPQLGSGSVTLKDLRASVVFLNFWATWCPPCKQEMPSMERLYRRHKDQGFTILAISIDANGVDRVATFVNKLGLTFPIGLDSKLEVANRYTVRALPSSFLVDKNGKIVAVALGPRDWDRTAAHAIVESLLE